MPEVSEALGARIARWHGGQLAIALALGAAATWIAWAVTYRSPGSLGIVLLAFGAMLAIPAMMLWATWQWLTARRRQGPAVPVSRRHP